MYLQYIMVSIGWCLVLIAERIGVITGMIDEILKNGRTIIYISIKGIIYQLSFFASNFQENIEKKH